MRPYSAGANTISGKNLFTQFPVIRTSSGQHSLYILLSEAFLFTGSNAAVHVHRESSKNSSKLNIVYIALVRETAGAPATFRYQGHGQRALRAFLARRRFVPQSFRAFCGSDRERIEPSSSSRRLIVPLLFVSRLLLPLPIRFPSAHPPVFDNRARKTLAVVPLGCRPEHTGEP